MTTDLEKIVGTVEGNLRRLRAEIAEIADRFGITGEVRLMAVSKNQTLSAIQDALAQGQTLFGENKVQEAASHWDDLRPAWPAVELHLIGPLQSNKAAEAVRLFDCIETVDRPKLVDALVREMGRQNKTLSCLIQVNTGEEDQKAGVTPDALPGLLQYCQSARLPIGGLMCIPPADEPPALHFALLKKLADRHQVTGLSMGMSADFAKAIPLGSTIVRIGTAIFGERV